jgi:hypothetical protein
MITSMPRESHPVPMPFAPGFVRRWSVIAAPGAPTQSSRSRATRVPRHTIAAARESRPLLTPFAPAFAFAPAAHLRQFLIRYQQLENNVNPWKQNPNENSNT